MIASLGIIGTINIVGSGSAGNTLTTTRAIPAGRFLVVASAYIGAGANTLSSVSDSASNTWNLFTPGSLAGASCCLAWAYVKNPIASGGSVTATWVTGGGGTALAVYEYAGTSGDSVAGVREGSFQGVVAGTTVTTQTGASAADTGRHVTWFGMAAIATTGGITGTGGAWVNIQNTQIGTVGRINYQENDLKAAPGSGFSITASWAAAANGSIAGGLVFAGPEQMHDQGFPRRNRNAMQNPAVYRSRQ